ncbi:MAG: RNA-dependent RNA polymerase [Sanya orius sauteri totivirus 1]|nr:MAG: RNA-dependent RNA polymerase [Sanya orius sauteri totivirus 1]
MKNLENTYRRDSRIEALRRFRVIVPDKFPVPQTSSFCGPLFTYYKALTSIGQKYLASTLLGLLFVIRNKFIYYIKNGFLQYNQTDDFFRKHLKVISGFVFPGVFTGQTANRFFLHIHSLGGRAPYEVSDIIDDITKWVSYKPPFPQSDFVDSTLTSLFTLFPTSTLDTHLNFKEFSNDPWRWGTSGGAPKSTLLGEAHRTKWSWAFSKLFNPDGSLNTDVDLYEQALLESQTAKVALKEEPTKTRAVITTPMASYIRQCYLLYRWGKPKINSPIGKSNWLSEFQKVNYAFYGCIDGDKFDQTIPKSFIVNFIDRMGKLDEECRRVADMEIASLETLQIEWNNRVWNWQGGLLSGWRMTSIMGSFVSLLVAEYIKSKTSFTSMEAGVLGDDLILYSHYRSISAEIMCHYYNEFGLRANMSKTTAGSVGEFLRKTYTPYGVYGYPALGLRSIFYANPWLDVYQVEKHQEMSRNWLTFYSRLLPYRTNENIHGWIRKCMLENMYQRWGKRNIFNDWISTPITCGGGGPNEWSDRGRWTVLRELSNYKNSNNRLESFLNIFGIKTKEKEQPTLIDFKKLDYTKLLTREDFLEHINHYYSIRLPTGINLTNIIVRWYFNDDIPAVHLTKELNLLLPRGLRTGGKSEILNFLLGVYDKTVGLVSAQCSPECVGQNLRLAKAAVISFLAAKKGMKSADVAASAHLYAATLYSKLLLPSSSW